MTSKSNVLIVALWALSIVGAVQGALERPAEPTLLQMSGPMAVAVLMMPVLCFGAFAFWARHSPFYHPKLAGFINSRCGENAFESFLVRLKPLLMFALAASLQGGVGLLLSHNDGAPWDAYLSYGFLLSAGLAFAVAHVVLYSRRVVGVFPTWAVSRPSVAGVPHTAEPQKKSLSEALRIYWKSLIGIAVFPTIAFVGGDVLHVPFEFFILPFFAVALFAGYPFLSGKAPYSFWLVGMLLWLIGGVVAFIASHLAGVVLR